jgi:hypothetical protein
MNTILHGFCSRIFSACTSVRQVRSIREAAVVFCLAACVASQANAARPPATNKPNGPVGTAEVWLNRSAAWAGSANGNNSSWGENDVIPVRWQATLKGQQKYRIYLLQDFKTDSDARHFADSFYQYDLSPAKPGLVMPGDTNVLTGTGVAAFSATRIIPLDNGVTNVLTGGVNDPVSNSAMPNQGGSRVLKLAGVVDDVAVTKIVGYQTRAGSVNGRGDFTKALVLDIVVSGAAGANTQVVIAYGAHLASRFDYGAGNGATGWGGSGGKFGVMVDEAITNVVSDVAFASLQSTAIFSSQTAQLTALQGSSQFYGNMSFTLTVTPKDANTGANTNLPVTFRIVTLVADGGTATSATINNSQGAVTVTPVRGTATATLTLNGTGVAMVQATVAANPSYESVSSSASFTVKKAIPTGKLNGITNSGLNTGVNSSGNVVSLTSVVGQAVTLRADVLGTAAAPAGGGNAVSFWLFFTEATFNSYVAAVRAGNETLAKAIKTAPGNAVNLNVALGFTPTYSSAGSTGSWTAPTLNYPTLGPGMHWLAFDYAGDGNYAAFDPEMPWGVDQVPTSTAVSSTITPIFGKPNSFTALVTSSLPQFANFNPSDATHGFVEGEVEFYLTGVDGTTLWATVPVTGQANGVAKAVSPKVLLPANYTVTAIYKDGTTHAYTSSQASVSGVLTP